MNSEIMSLETDGFYFREYERRVGRGNSSRHEHYSTDLGGGFRANTQSHHQELSGRQIEDCEWTILWFLSLKHNDFALKRNTGINPANTLREAIMNKSYRHSRPAPILNTLINETRILRQNKAGDQVVSIGLNFTGIIENIDKPFVTNRVLRRTYNVLLSLQNQSEADLGKAGLSIDQIANQAAKLSQRLTELEINHTPPSKKTKSLAFVLPMSRKLRNQLDYEDRQLIIPTADVAQTKFEDITAEEKQRLSNEAKFLLALRAPKIANIVFNNQNDLFAAIVREGEIDLNDENGRYDPLRLPAIIKALKGTQDQPARIVFKSNGSGIDATKEGRELLLSEIKKAKYLSVEAATDK